VEEKKTEDEKLLLSGNRSERVFNIDWENCWLASNIWEWLKPFDNVNSNDNEKYSVFLKILDLTKLKEDSKETDWLNKLDDENCEDNKRLDEIFKILDWLNRDENSKRGEELKESEKVNVVVCKKEEEILSNWDEEKVALEVNEFESVKMKVSE
jgi:hypothetical protein